MQDYILNRENFGMLNLYSEGNEFDDFSLINLCKVAVDNGVKSISVPEENVNSVWEWLELSDVKLCAIVNNFSGNMTVEDIFRKIKSVVNNGADVVEIFMPPETFNVDIENITPKLDETLCAIAEAKGIRKAKISMESSFIKNCSMLKGAIYLLSKYKIDILKTASGRFIKNSTLEQLNAILEEAKSSRISVDFMPNLDGENKFIIDDSYRLASCIIGKEDIENLNFSISIPEHIFSRIIKK